MSKIKVTMRDKKKIIDYLASPVGEAVFVEIEGKDDGARRRSSILNTCSRTTGAHPARTWQWLRGNHSET